MIQILVTDPLSDAGISVLKDAQVQRTELVIGVTSSETTNITVCVLAKQMGANRTIARISNTEFIENQEVAGFKKFGIDELISPESLAASEIELLLNQSAFNDSYEFENGALTMVGTSLSRTASFVGKSVKEAARIFPTLHFMPIAIQREGTQYTLIPRGDTIFKEGDDGSSLFVILFGTIELVKLSDGGAGKGRVSLKEGREKVVGEMSVASVFGEISLLTGRNRSVTTRVISSQVVLMEITNKFLDSLIPSIQAKFHKQLLLVLAKNLDTMNMRYAKLVSSVEVREQLADGGEI